MANFQYKSGTWQDVPLRACPQAGAGSVLLVYPETADMTGQGAPCGAFGLPWIEVRADAMYAGSSVADGMRWWQSLFALTTDLTAAISLSAYNARTGAWEKYAGTLWRPTWDEISEDYGDGSRIYTGVRIFVRDVTATT